MKNDYISVPQTTTLNEIKERNFSLSATQYKTFCVKNKNLVNVKALLDRALKREDLGTEVGSEKYVDFSKYIFIKTKALQEESYLISEVNDATEYISPLAFEDMKLKKGDIIMSKDSNVGEIIILDKDYPNAMLCGGLYRLPITKNKYYFLAFAKSQLFRQQIDFLVPRGSTIRHGKTKFLECNIPMPNKNKINTVKYVETLMKAIINKECEIRRKHNLILEEIDKELENNQKESQYTYSMPLISDLLKFDRMDSSLYSFDFQKKERKISNYKYGTSSITDLGFKFVRGNNLAVSVIGKSIYSDEYHNGFYTLLLPKNISKYGTINRIEYLGNNSKLLEIEKGAIIFGAEGNEKGRSYVVIDKHNRMITNFHGLTLYHKDFDVNKSVFVKIFLDYLRSKGMIDAYATGGNGGSLSIKYWSIIPFPNIPDSEKKKIVNLYYVNKISYSSKHCKLEDFLKYDDEFNKNAGIYEIDLSLKYLQKLLNDAIEKISNDEEVEIIF